CAASCAACQAVSRALARLGVVPGGAGWATGWARAVSGKGRVLFLDAWTYEVWRFLFLQHEVAKDGQTCLDYPPMQKGACCNLDALKQELEQKMASHASHEVARS